MTLREPPLVELLRFLVGSVVSHPDRVNISRVETPRTDLFYLTVHADDLGRLLGREGKTVEAIRTMVDVAAVQYDKTAVVDVVEPRRKSADKPADKPSRSRRKRPRRGRRKGEAKAASAKRANPGSRKRSNPKKSAAS